jgi:hypothetical protein
VGTLNEADQFTTQIGYQGVITIKQFSCKHNLLKCLKERKCKHGYINSFHANQINAKCIDINKAAAF